MLSPGAFAQHERSGVLGCQPPYLPLASRPDVVVFRSAPLEHDLEIIGGVTATIYVSVDTVDTDVTAKLIDEYPPSAATPHGDALNVSDSIVRLRYRHGRKPQLVQPGTVVEVVITLYPTANRFQAGHRLRLDVSSSNFPRFDVNPNTGEAPGTERRRRDALVTVHHNGSYPSRVELATVAS